MIVSLLMVVGTIVVGLSINDEAWFVALEVLLTLVILADYILRMKLQGA